MKSTLSDMNDEGANDNRVPEDDVEEEHALLESVQITESDGVQSSLGGDGNDQKKGINV